MRLLIAGDLTIQDRAAKINWDSAALQRSFGEVKGIIERCDHALVNLESPITENSEPYLKDGPTLKNPYEVFDVVRYCGFDTLTLANNHLKDYGCQGVIDTIAFSKQAGLNVVGAGIDIAEARKPLILDEDNCFKVGIINVCEHESSIASVEAGANPLDLGNLFYDILDLKNKVDRVIVVIHGGREHYQFPTPRMKKAYHLIADYGADVVVNHHQHCYSGFELYKGKPIFYGLGNFFFDRSSKRNDKWNEGLLLQLDLTKDNVDFRLVPYKQCNGEPVIKCIYYDDIKCSIEELNMIIESDNKLENEFLRLVSSSKPLWPFIPLKAKPFRALYVRGFLPEMLSKKAKVVMRNAISCETHREVLMKFFDVNIKR